MSEPSADRRDEGLSLVELLVAMTVLAVVLLIVGNLFVTVTTATRAANSSRNAVGQASNSMDEIARVIRMGTPNPVVGSSVPAYAVSAGTASTITVLSYVDASSTAPTPSQVSFAVTSATGALVETRTVAVASGSYSTFPTTAPSTSRTVASGLTSIAFTYADSDGNPITPAGTGTPTPLTDDQRKAVASVTVVVTAANTSLRTSDPIVLTSTVLLTNVALNNGSGS